MRVVSLNVNGIRAAAKKGFFDWLNQTKPDVVCLQEVRAHEHQLEDEIFWPKGYHCYYVEAEKKGYSGVAIYSKQEPDDVFTTLGYELCDQEGRFIQANFGKLKVISLYLPSGTSGDVRQTEKYAFMDHLTPLLKKWVKQKDKMIICGDWNIAHKNIDIKNWKSNQKHSGFLPEERAWLDKIFDDIGWVDGFRVVDQAPDQYTWWSNRGRAWENNTGWRIDYQVITPNLKDHVQKAEIYKAERFSDHAPLILTYDE